MCSDLQKLSFQLRKSSDNCYSSPNNIFIVKRALIAIFPVYTGLHESSPNQLETTLHVTFALIGRERSEVTSDIDR